jgi:hypothetical protein
MQTRNPLRISRQRAWISYDCFFRFLSVSLRRHARRMVMMVMAMMVQRSHDSLMLGVRPLAVKLFISRLPEWQELGSPRADGAAQRSRKPRQQIPCV